MDDELRDKIQSFKCFTIDKPPIKLVNHYKEELLAMQDALNVISGKWKMQIIALLCNGEFRLSDLERGIPKITQKKLAKELAILEHYNLIEKIVHNSKTNHVTYKLQDYGYTLVPLIIELTHWGKAYRKHKLKPSTKI